MKSILHLQKSMMAHFPASYNSNGYLGDYSYSYKGWNTYDVHFEGVGCWVGREICLKLDVQGQEGGTVLDLDG